MFIDVAKIFVKAGDGGNGAVAFHREKYVANGGPDGGDGGNGGGIVFVTDSHMNTLLDFKYKRKYVAENGENGKTSKCYGKSGKDLQIKVPVGTVIKDCETGKIIHDMSDGKPFKILKGGNGGFGNTHFATPTRQCPRFAKNGEKGGERMIMLELKLLADVGLIGFPNVGKSTFLSMVSAARPKIANYHFTTLVPQLGVVSPYDGETFVMADIPGLIEGASNGEGLGHEFLRHIERCRMLVHIVDISASEGRDPIDDFEKINCELERFSPDLAKLPQVVCGNKSDIISDENTADRFADYITKKGLPYFKISAASKQGLNDVIKYVYSSLGDLPPLRQYGEEINIDELIEKNRESREVEITFNDGVFFVRGEWIYEKLHHIDPSDYEDLSYMNKLLKNTGVYDKLEQRGVKPGDTIDIYNLRFEYYK